MPVSDRSLMMQLSGRDQQEAAIGILHRVSPSDHSPRGDQQDAAPLRQPTLVTPASTASPFFLAYIPCLDTYMHIDPQQIGAGPSRGGPLPTPDCIWFNDAWRPFVRIEDHHNPSYAQVVGQDTLATSPPSTQEEHSPAPPARREPADDFALLVFGPHPRHTDIRSAKLAVAQAMRQTNPPIVVPL